MGEKITQCLPCALRMSVARTQWHCHLNFTFFKGFTCRRLSLSLCLFLRMLMRLLSNSWWLWCHSLVKFTRKNIQWKKVCTFVFLKKKNVFEVKQWPRFDNFITWTVCIFRWIKLDETYKKKLWNQMKQATMVDVLHAVILANEIRTYPQRLHIYGKKMYGHIFIAKRHYDIALNVIHKNCTNQLVTQHKIPPAKQWLNATRMVFQNAAKHNASHWN